MWQCISKEKRKRIKIRMRIHFAWSFGYVKAYWQKSTGFLLKVENWIKIRVLCKFKIPKYFRISSSWGTKKLIKYRFKDNFQLSSQHSISQQTTPIEIPVLAQLQGIVASPRVQNASWRCPLATRPLSCTDCFQRSYN